MKHETRTAPQIPNEPESRTPFEEQDTLPPQTRQSTQNPGTEGNVGTDANGSSPDDSPASPVPDPLPDPAPADLPTDAPATDPAGNEPGEAPAVDPVDPAPAASDPASDRELERLREELNGLREQITRVERLGAEYAEFYELYPRVALSELPDSVWETVRRGVPLAAAYALEERKRARTAEVAREQNERNRARSSGSPDRAIAGEFSAAEVRAMSPAEVRKNYRQILLSMQNWK